MVKNKLFKYFLISFILLISPIITNAQIQFIKHSLDHYFQGAFTVYATDVDSDGKIDILAAGQDNSTIAWWHNQGNKNFNKNIVDSNIRGAWCVYATDLTSDGAIDVLGTSCADDYIAWYENDGNENFSKYIVDVNFLDAEWVHAADYDNDGDIDVVGIGWGGNTVAWWENDGQQHFTKHIIDDLFFWGHAVVSVDLNNDGYIDIAAVGAGSRNVVWYKNKGDKSFVENTIDSDFSGAYSIFTEDIDSDGDFDLVAAAHSENCIAWYENDGSGSFTNHIIDHNFTEAIGVSAADIDNDGDIDILGAAKDDDTIACYENDGQENFTKHIVDDTFYGARHVYAADLDGDGDKDIIGAALYGNEVAWWEVITPKPTMYSIDGKVLYYSNSIPVPNVKITVSGYPSLTDYTDQNGSYSFTIAKGNSFNITPLKSAGSDISGYTIIAYDAALTARQAVYLDTLNYYQRIAADADLDGNILTFDAVLICRYAVGLSPFSSSHVGEWAFVPNKRSYQNLSQDFINENYEAVIIGDVHGDWTSSGLGKPQIVTHDYDSFPEVIKVEKYNKVALPIIINSEEEVISVDIDIEYDSKTLKFENIVSGELMDGFKWVINNESGRIRMGLFRSDAIIGKGKLLDVIFRAVGNRGTQSDVRLTSLRINNKLLFNGTSRVLVKGNIKDYELLVQNYPNPFNSSTSISYHVTKSSQVELKIYNLLGQVIRKLVDEYQQSGSYHVIWDGKDGEGNEVVSGEYIYQIIINNYTLHKKLIKLE